MICALTDQRLGHLGADGARCAQGLGGEVGCGGFVHERSSRRLPEPPAEARQRAHSVGEIGGRIGAAAEGLSELARPHAGHACRLAQARRIVQALGVRCAAAEQLHAVRAQQREQARQLALVQVEAPDGADVLEQALAVRRGRRGQRSEARDHPPQPHQQEHAQRDQRCRACWTSQPRSDGDSRWRIRNSSPGSLALGDLGQQLGMIEAADLAVGERAQGREHGDLALAPGELQDARPAARGEPPGIGVFVEIGQRGRGQQIGAQLACRRASGSCRCPRRAACPALRRSSSSAPRR